MADTPEKPAKMTQRQVKDRLIRSIRDLVRAHKSNAFNDRVFRDDWRRIWRKLTDDLGEQYPELFESSEWTYGK